MINTAAKRMGEALARLNISLGAHVGPILDALAAAGADLERCRPESPLRDPLGHSVGGQALHPE